KATEARGGTDSGHGGEFAVGAVKVDQVANVDVGDAISVGEKERFAADPVAKTLDAAAGIGVKPGIYQVHAPARLLLVVHDGFAAAKVDGEVVIQGVKVQEVVFNALALVTEGHDELGETISCVDIHEMPEHGLAADFDHGLRLDLGLFGEA